MKPDDAQLTPGGATRASVHSWRGGALAHEPDWLADEVPVALVFNGVSHAVMLVSPADLEDFALGFGLSEGLLARPSELYGVDVEPVGDGIELRIDVAAACEMRLRQRRRTLAGRTGCGLCGTDSLAQVKQVLPPAPVVRTTPAAVARAQRGLRIYQALQQLTGAAHAAAWCSLDGDVRLVREDIGRHNALDKLIGAMSRAGTRPGDGFVCITSRASFEMVQKSAMAGTGLLAAVSAPTALAVQTARHTGIGLAGFVRDDDFVAYTFPERFGLTSD